MKLELLFSLGAALCSRFLYLIRSVHGNQCDILHGEVGLCSSVRHQRLARLILVPLLLLIQRIISSSSAPIVQGNFYCILAFPVSPSMFLPLLVGVMGLKASVMSRWHSAAAICHVGDPLGHCMEGQMVPSPIPL